MDPKKYFIDLQNLLELERKEDKRSFDRSVLLSNQTERKRKGLTWYPVKVSKVEMGYESHLHLTINREQKTEDQPKFRIGKIATLYNNSHGNKTEECIEGVVEAVGKNRMRMSIDLGDDQYLPDWLDYGILGVDVSFDTPSYKKMKATVSSMIKMESSKNRLFTLRDILLGIRAPSFRAANEQQFQPISHLNESQNKAVLNILTAEDVALIHGPPGTGKTTTMVAAIKLTLEKEKQVLVTAPSNAAVDMLTDRLVHEGINVLRIGNPLRMADKVVESSLESKIEKHTDYHFLKRLREEANNFRLLIRRVSDSKKKKDFSEEFHKVKKEARILEKVIVKEIIDKTTVITATLAGATHSDLGNRTFSTVFIDEAAQALEPICWIPISKANRIIMSGDHLQLPPVVKSKEAAAQGLSETLFERIKKNHNVSVMLDTQYRMNEKIMKFSSKQFYDYQLKADATVKDWHILGDEENFRQVSEPVEFIDTAGMQYYEENFGDTESLVNYKEADLLISHLRELKNFLFGLFPDSSQSLSIGINSPYKAQINHLADLLTKEDYFGLYKNIEVNTVDGFQGQERDIIYISLVRSNLNSNIGFLSETRRMNVALTRARKKLIVIGDSETLLEHNFYRSFITYVKNNGYYQTVTEWKSDSVH